MDFNVKYKQKQSASFQNKLFIPKDLYKKKVIMNDNSF